MSWWVFVRLVVHHPERQGSLSKCPIMVMAPDYPIRKRQPGGLFSTMMMDVSINDGLHLHGVVRIRTDTRLRQALSTHIKASYKEYIRPGFALRRIDVRPISHSLENVADYCFKTLKRRDMDLDDVLILPKARSEMVDRIHSNSRQTARLYT